MAEVARVPAAAAVPEEEAIHKVPDPLPLTLAGMLAAVGPQAINFGISIGGGEAYLLPNVSARGTLHMHWLMLISVVIESALVYECIKYSICTGRSFFAATNDLAPRGFWPWFWAVAAVLTWAWPAWMGGAVIAAQRFTGISTQMVLPGVNLPPQWIWAAIALVLVLVVFYFSDIVYRNIARIFTAVMFANILLVLAITLIAAQPEDYVRVFLGYFGITFLLEGYPLNPDGTPRLPFTDALALYNQPGGSLMWVSFWVIGAGFGMGRYAGQVTGVLRPPERITTRALRWDTSDPEERRKMHQWVKVGGYSLFLWWAIIGGFLMTYLYSVAGLAYLHDQFLATGRIPTGVEVPVQMATIATGVLGPLAGWLMLLFIMVTLYDAQFPFYDTFIGRTTCDAIAVSGKARRPYRFYYFVIVTAVVLAGFYLVTVAQPFILWLGVAISAIVYRSIGSLQIMRINDKLLPDGFKVGPVSRALLWFSFVTGIAAVAVWFVTVFPAEACRQAGLFCP